MIWLFHWPSTTGWGAAFVRRAHAVHLQRHLSPAECGAPQRPGEVGRKQFFLGDGCLKKLASDPRKFLKKKHIGNCVGPCKRQITNILDSHDTFFVFFWWSNGLDHVFGHHRFDYLQPLVGELLRCLFSCCSTCCGKHTLLLITGRPAIRFDMVWPFFGHCG